MIPKWLRALLLIHFSHCSFREEKQKDSLLSRERKERSDKEEEGKRESAQHFLQILPARSLPLGTRTDQLQQHIFHFEIFSNSKHEGKLQMKQGLSLTQAELEKAILRQMAQLPLQPNGWICVTLLNSSVYARLLSVSSPSSESQPKSLFSGPSSGPSSGPLSGPSSEPPHKSSGGPTEIRLSGGRMKSNWEVLREGDQVRIIIASDPLPMRIAEQNMSLSNYKRKSCPKNLNYFQNAPPGYETIFDRLLLFLAWASVLHSSLSSSHIFHSERRDKKTENLKRQSSHGILLYGPPGVGKTTICKTLVQQVQRDGNVQIDWISATSPLQIKNMAFDCVSTPTLRIIDSGHLLAMGQGEHALSTLAMSLERAYEENEPVVTIVVLTWPDTFDKNPSVSSPWASLCQTTRLGHIVQMERPSYNQRHQILLSSFQSDFALLRKEDGKETEREEGTLKWIPQLASRTAGFCARDLIQLVQTTVGLAHASNTEESISQHSHMMPNVVQFALQKCLTNQSSLSIETEIPAITWDDVSGVAQVRQRLEEHLLWPLLHPEQLERLGLDSGTSGVLLHGKGGTGKTLCAHAFLNSISSHMNVISVKASHLFSKYLGESEAAVRRLFSRARSMAPCILFFDEFDSIGARRSGGGYGGGSENEDSGGVRGRVVSQLLNEMDGVSFRVGEEKKRGVRREQIFLLGSTSRLEAVDDAFVRPGRFGTVINMPPLSLSDRVEALLIHSRDMKFADDVDLNAIALLTPNWTGSNLAMLCRNASLCALRQDLETEFVSSQHFFSAMNTIH